MNQYTFHLLGLSHLPASKEYSSCAFTNKNIKLSKMLLSLGHTVYLYGAKTTNKKYNIEKYMSSDNFYFVETHTVDDIAKSFGTGNNIYEIGYDWLSTDYKHDLNSPPTDVTKKFYANAIEHINKIKKPDDFLLCTQGKFHKSIVDAVGFSSALVVESGIGYRSGNQGWHRVFESQHGESFLYGSEHPFASINGQNYDRIIGNYFDPDDIEFSAEKEDYFLFCARLIRRKGILEAYLACKEIGKKLIIAGQGGRILPDGSLTCQYPGEFTISPDSDWEYIGFVDIDKRKHLMAKAQGFFSITEYLEMFSGAHIEAMLSGTPVITSNFGVYAGNTFVDGVHGFKGNTLDDFVFAAQNCKKLDPYVIRKNAERYLMDNLKWEYERLWDDLYHVYLSTLDNNVKGWHYIRKEVPNWRNYLYPTLTEK